MKEFKAVYDSCPNKKEGKGKVLEKLRKQKWHVGGRVTQGHDKKILSMETVNKFFDIVRDGRKNDPDLAVIFDAFILNVGFYIAGMTNTEAFKAYNKIYGHTL